MCRGFAPQRGVASFLADLDGHRASDPDRCDGWAPVKPTRAPSPNCVPVACNPSLAWAAATHSCTVSNPPAPPATSPFAAQPGWRLQAAQPSHRGSTPSDRSDTVTSWLAGWAALAEGRSSPASGEAVSPQPAALCYGSGSVRSPPQPRIDDEARWRASPSPSPAALCTSAYVAQQLMPLPPCPSTGATHIVQRRPAGPDVQLAKRMRDEQLAHAAKRQCQRATGASLVPLHSWPHSLPVWSAPLPRTASPAASRGSDSVPASPTLAPAGALWPLDERWDEQVVPDEQLFAAGSLTGDDLAAMRDVLADDPELAEFLGL